MRTDSETTMPPSAVTAISDVPPPTSRTSEPIESATGRSAPIAAASGSSIRYARDAPAPSVASSTADRSTCVTPLGMHTITSAPAPKRWNAVRMKYRSICSVVSKSAITPCRSGRVALMCAGVRPIIRRASAPTA